MPTLLAIDDELGVRESYRLIFRDRYRVLVAENGREGLERLERTHVDLILLDYMMPGFSGADVLDELSRRGEDTPVIVVTALNAVDAAVECIKRGAREYIIKPFDVDEISLLVERTLAEARAKRELRALRDESRQGFEALIGASPALERVFDLARKAMRVDSTVLVTGESGTGKELLARAIHGGGARSGGPFIPLSCCAIPQHLVESELFGHERGAFTGAVERRVGKLQIADRGTLFLDEIGEMPLDAQSRLLRVLQDRQFYPVGSVKSIEVDVRVICATNRNLPEAIATNLFREDLYYRINVMPIDMPPLRQRREDIPLLVEHFLAKHGPRVNAVTRSFAPETLGLMAAYAWPGNVRELENTVHRLLIQFGDQIEIGPELLRGVLPELPGPGTSDLVEFEGLPLEEATQRLERHLIVRALARADRVQSRAAELLGVTRRILKYKMDQLGIPADLKGKTDAV